MYNGIEREKPAARQRERDRRLGDKIVLFLGRITMQKGPSTSSPRPSVFSKVSGVKFVIAGSGDMALRMVELAASMGIGHKVIFTGFLRGGTSSVFTRWRTATSYPA